MDISFNYKGTKKVPINRNNLFYDENSFLFDVEVGRDYLSQDLHQTVILFQVDLEKTNLDTIYNETKKDDIVFKTPIELPCIYNLEDAMFKSYDSNKNNGLYKKTGTLEIGVYEDTLSEYNCDIKIGDYIGVQVNPTLVVYFSVANDGKNNIGNSQTMFGYKPFYRVVKAVPVDENEFRGL